MPERNISPRPAPGSGRVRLPDWALLARHRKAWTRIRMFHWPFPMARPVMDNSVPERLGRGMTLFSRIVGPLLLLAAIIGVGWLIFPYLR